MTSEKRVMIGVKWGCLAEDLVEVTLPESEAIPGTGRAGIQHSPGHRRSRSSRRCRWVLSRGTITIAYLHSAGAGRGSGDRCFLRERRCGCDEAISLKGQARRATEREARGHRGLTQTVSYIL